MVTKIALILLLLGATVVAEDWPVDTLSIRTIGIQHHYIEKDTSRYYVVEVNERTKCDTFSVDTACPDYKPGDMWGCAVLHFRTVVVCDDTVWAPKIQVWLTPAQLKKLMKGLGE